MLEDTLTCGYWTWLFFAGDEHYTVNLAVAVDTVSIGIALGKRCGRGPYTTDCPIPILWKVAE